MGKIMDLELIQAEYDQLRSRLANLGWISQGHVGHRGPRGPGPRYQWTRKLGDKTVTVLLSKEQYAAFKQANENWRGAQLILKRMQVLSRQFIFSTYPHPIRRKPLSRKVLGLI